MEPLFAVLEERGASSKEEYEKLRREFRSSTTAASGRIRRPRHEMPVSKQTRYLIARRAFDDANYAKRNMPRLLLLGLVSEYDAFLAMLVRAIFSSREELIRGIDRTLSISDVLGLERLEDAITFIVEKEVETILRNSHEEQLSDLERRFDLKTLRAFDRLNDFIEITERRNLVAHNGGIVTNRYLVTCKNAGIANTAGMVAGDELEMDGGYLRQAYDVLFQVGVRLAHVLWRKVRPDQMDLSDKVLSRTCYTLLVFEEFELARETLTFAMGLPKHSSEQEKRIFAVNLAQTYKWLGNEEECRKILRGHDWTASDDAFMMATYVLQDDFEEAARRMVVVAQNGDVPEAAFHDWPLFREFRNSPLFAPAYEEAFGRQFVQ
jgi:hypothetical protein